MPPKKNKKGFIEEHKEEISNTSFPTAEPLKPQFSAPSYLQSLATSDLPPFKLPSKEVRPKLLVGPNILITESDVVEVIAGEDPVKGLQKALGLGCKCSCSSHKHLPRPLDQKAGSLPTKPSGLPNSKNVKSISLVPNVPRRVFKLPPAGQLLVKKNIIQNYDLVERNFLCNFLDETVSYAAQRDYSGFKLSVLFTIYLTTHLYFKSYYWSPPVAIWNYFKELVIRHTIENSPDSQEVFDPNECYDILTHFHTMYISNLPLIHILTFGSHRLRLSWPFKPSK